MTKQINPIAFLLPWIFTTVWVCEMFSKEDKHQVIYVDFKKKVITEVRNVA